MKWLSKGKVLAALSVFGLGLLTLIAGGVYFLTSPEFERLAGDYIVRSVEERTGGNVSLGSFEADFRGQRFVLNGLILRGDEDPSDPALAVVDRIDIGFRLRSLIGREIDLSSLTVVRPRIRVVIDESGETNVPVPPAVSGRRSMPLELFVGDLVVSEGELVVGERRVDIDFSLASVDGSFDYRETSGVLSGHLEYEGAVERTEAPVIPYALSLDFDYTNGTVLVHTANLRSGETELSLQGRIDEALRSRRGVLEYAGVVDLPFLDYFFADEQFGGSMDVRGRLDFSTEHFASSGDLTAPLLSVDDWMARDVVSEFEYRFPERTLRATGLEANVVGGQVMGSVSVLPLPGPARVELDLRYANVDTAELRRIYPWDPQYVLQSRATGQIEGWFQGRFELLDLRGVATFEPDTERRTPDGTGLTLGGSGRFAATTNGVEVGDLEIQLGSTHVIANGAIHRTETELEIELTSEDLRDLALVYPGSNGRGTFSGEVTGQIGQPDLTGRFSIAGYQYEEWTIDSIEGDATLISTEVELRNVRIRKGDSEIEISGDASLTAEPQDLDINIVRVDAEDVRPLLAWPVEGWVTGRAHVASIEPLEVQANFRADDLAYRENRIGTASGDLAVDASHVRLTDLLIEQEDGSLKGSLAYDLESAGVQFRFDAAGQSIEKLEWLGFPGGFEGTLQEASFKVDGIRSEATDHDFLIEGFELDIDGRLEIEGLSYGGDRIGTASGGVRVEASQVRLTDVLIQRGDGFLRGSLAYDSLTKDIQLQFDGGGGPRLAVFERLGVPSGFDGTLREASFDIAGTTAAPVVDGVAVIDDLQFRQMNFREAVVRVVNSGRSIQMDIETSERLHIQAEVDPAQDDYPFRGSAEFIDYDGAQITGMTEGSLIATGTASFEGALGDLSSLRGSGRVNALAVSLESEQLRISDPFDVQFDSETLQVSTIQLGGPASLAVAGTVALSANALLDLTIRGNVDLSLLGSDTSDVEMSGQILLDGRIGGTLATPELEGSGSVRQVALGHRSLFLGLSSLNGALSFDRNLVVLNGIRGSAGGGTINIQGTVSVEDRRPGIFDIRLDGTNVRVRTPEGLRTVFDAALDLRGTAAEPSLEGDLEVRSLSFNESFEAFLELFRPSPEGAEAGPLDDLALAIHIGGDRNIRIENDVARVDSRLDLDVGGTFGTPSMTGHVEATDGTFDFQGNRYRITRGNVDFVDPTGIEPQLDVQAEADLRRYRILLLISGPADDLRLSMNSDPPLSELEIVSLIGGGRTREELAADQSGTGALPTSEALFQGGAATILSDLLQSRVGSRLGVLSRVRVDPFLVGAENDPAARLTISEQITRDLAVTYSQDLSSNRQQIIVIEYFLNSDTSFIASRDETGALGLDVKFRQRLD